MIVPNEKILFYNTPKLFQKVYEEEVTSVAPGKKKAIASFKDNYCEKFAFPHLFPVGKF